MMLFDVISTSKVENIIRLMVVGCNPFPIASGLDHLV
jgi:hypothetical protein